MEVRVGLETCFLTVDCGRKESLEDLGGQEASSMRPVDQRGRGADPAGPAPPLR